MGKQYTATLSVASVEKLKQDLINYKDKYLAQKASQLAEELAKIGVESAKANVASLDAVFTGELTNSIHTKKGKADSTSAVFFVVVDSEHAMFVEFGTGQRGKENPYKHKLPEGVTWSYNGGKTIFQISPGEYGWFFPMDDGTWRFTQGMPSRPFMYEAMMDIMDRVVETARRVFSS